MAFYFPLFGEKDRLFNAKGGRKNQSSGTIAKMRCVVSSALPLSWGCTQHSPPPAEILDSLSFQLFLNNNIVTFS